MAVVVSEASLLICLTALGHFSLLHQLYDEVVVPAAVWQEITQAPAFSSAAAQEPAAEAQAAGWLRVAAASSRPLVTQLEAVLDAEGAEAIALALEVGPCILLINEREGRQRARALKVSLTGTLRPGTTPCHYAQP